MRVPTLSQFENLPRGPKSFYARFFVFFFYGCLCVCPLIDGLRLFHFNLTMNFSFEPTINVCTVFIYGELVVVIDSVITDGK